MYIYKILALPQWSTVFNLCPLTKHLTFLVHVCKQILRDNSPHNYIIKNIKFCMKHFSFVVTTLKLKSIVYIAGVLLSI